METRFSLHFEDQLFLFQEDIVEKSLVPVSIAATLVFLHMLTSPQDYACRTLQHELFLLNYHKILVGCEHTSVYDYIQVST